eukprot:18235-Lingulodinium_polyedra.AAC.1
MTVVAAEGVVTAVRARSCPSFFHLGAPWARWQPRRRFAPRQRVGEGGHGSPAVFCRAFSRRWRAAA